MRAGMDFSEAKKRVMRISQGPGHPEAKKNLINSVINQAGIREGVGAKAELIKAVNARAYSHEESSTFSGAGCKQTGFGPGKKLGDGRWQYIDGRWRKDE